MSGAPLVEKVAPPFVRVEGVFHRAVDPRFLSEALAGSRGAGRYSSPAQPTLYLSASPEGVRAAMIAHAGSRAGGLALVEIEVRADSIVDLRDAETCRTAGIDPERAASAWRQAAILGGQGAHRGDGRSRADRPVATGARAVAPGAFSLECRGRAASARPDQGIGRPKSLEPFSVSWNR